MFDACNLNLYLQERHVTADSFSLIEISCKGNNQLLVCEFHCKLNESKHRF